MRNGINPPARAIRWSADWPANNQSGNGSNFPVGTASERLPDRFANNSNRVFARRNPVVNDSSATVADPFINPDRIPDQTSRVFRQVVSVDCEIPTAVGTIRSGRLPARENAAATSDVKDVCSSTGERTCDSFPQVRRSKSECHCFFSSDPQFFAGLRESCRGVVLKQWLGKVCVTRHCNQPTGNTLNSLTIHDRNNLPLVVGATDRWEVLASQGHAQRFIVELFQPL